MFGRQVDGSEAAAPMDLVRLAFPRRTYTQSHADYLIEIFDELRSIKDQLSGYRIKWEPKLMRHFTCQFEPLDPKPQCLPSPGADSVKVPPETSLPVAL